MACGLTLDTCAQEATCTSCRCRGCGASFETVGGGHQQRDWRVAHRITICFAFARRETVLRAVKCVRKLLRSCIRPIARAKACLSSCARDLCWTPHASTAFTDVRTRPAGIVMALSHTTIEYTQPLVDPKQSLFDTNIVSGLQSVNMHYAESGRPPRPSV